MKTKQHIHRSGTLSSALCGYKASNTGHDVLMYWDGKTFSTETVQLHLKTIDDCTCRKCRYIWEYQNR